MSVPDDVAGLPKKERQDLEHTAWREGVDMADIGKALQALQALANRVPDDVAARTEALSEMDRLGGQPDTSDWQDPWGTGSFWLEFPNDRAGSSFWWMTGDNDDWSANARIFTSWDEVRVALDEVEERGSWWPET